LHSMRKLDSTPKAPKYGRLSVAKTGPYGQGDHFSKLVGLAHGGNTSILRRQPITSLEDIFTMTSKHSTLGSLIRLVRKKNSWTLRQLSEKVGIPLSTLAKVETDKLSLTYDKLQQFTASLGLSMTEFLAQGEAPPATTLRVFTARRSLTGRNNSIQISTPNYDYEYLCADLREKRMVPILTRIRSKDIAEFGEPLKHKGEEFIFVLEGTIEVHLQFYNPVKLSVGQGIYIDSTMGHAYVAKDCESALVLGVCSSEDPNLASELISLAANEAESTA
jgi:transcriptional regulator with XRE-family HTH domain